MHDRERPPPEIADPPASIRPIAFFDLDRTLIAGSSLLSLAEVAREAGMVRRSTLAKSVVRNAAFARRGAGDASIDRLTRMMAVLTAGRSYSDMVGVAATAAMRVGGRVFSGARMLIEQHVRSGDLVVVVSASPHELVTAVAVAIGADLGIGTRPEVVDGLLTGRIDGTFCYRDGKLIRICEELGAAPFHVASAYADSASDLPLLRACSRAVAVNPDRSLRRAARDAAWPIVRFG